MSVTLRRCTWSCCRLERSNETCRIATLTISEIKVHVFAYDILHQCTFSCSDFFVRYSFTMVNSHLYFMHHESYISKPYTLPLHLQMCLHRRTNERFLKTVGYWLMQTNRFIVSAFQRSVAHDFSCMHTTFIEQCCMVCTSLLNINRQGNYSVTVLYKRTNPLVQCITVYYLCFFHTVKSLRINERVYTPRRRTMRAYRLSIQYNRRRKKHTLHQRVVLLHVVKTRHNSISTVQYVHTDGVSFILLSDVQTIRQQIIDLSAQYLRC